MSADLQAVPTLSVLPGAVGYSVKNLLDWGRSALSNLETLEADSVAEQFLGELLKCNRAGLHLRLNEEIPRAEAETFFDWILKRQSGMPSGYILGKAYFWDLELAVGPGCLVPRPETEILVESVIRLAGFERDAFLKWADFGTGSGALSIALLRHFKNASAELIDISPEAARFAEENVARYELGTRAVVRIADGFSHLAAGKDSAGWDMIVSNPPYLSDWDLEHLDPEVRWEPRTALDGGPDGLVFYRRMIRESPEYLKSGGWLVLEMGIDQSRAVQDEIEASGKFLEPLVIRDYLGIERVVMAQKKVTEEAGN